MLFLVEMVWGFLYDTFRQLLTVLAVMLSRLDRGRFVVWDGHIGKHIGVQTEQVGSNRTVEVRRRLRGYSDGSPLVEVRTKAKRGRMAM
jgi:hypothetical protein